MGFVSRAAVSSPGRLHNESESRDIFFISMYFYIGYTSLGDMPYKALQAGSLQQ
jgi:hypothetical protein